MIESKKEKSVSLSSALTDQMNITDINNQFSRICQMLGEKTEDVVILDTPLDGFSYRTTNEWRDRVVNSAGPLDTLPPIMEDRMQSEKSTTPGIGVFIYESRIEPEIKYAIYTTLRQYGHHSNYVFVARRYEYRLRRIAHELTKKTTDQVEPPVLPEGVLDDVIQNTVGFLLKAKEISHYGIKIKRGIVLDGPPGNGKTMLCRYIQRLCNNNNIDFGIVTASEIDTAFKDQVLNELFSQYTVTFFDDIDIEYMNREKGNGKMACSLLTAMDGMADTGHLVRIFTTNEPVDSLDKAFVRPGRIDKKITLDVPSDKLRKTLVEKYWPKEIINNININRLMSASEGFSFAELEAIRTLLVTNKVLGSKDWDLEHALKKYNEQHNDKKVAMGFGK